jgi:hypothetical protein
MMMQNTAQLIDVEPTQAQIDEADMNMRFWQWPRPGHIELGSVEHKDMFSQMLLQSHNPYKPAIIAWPPLSTDERARLVNLPIWNLAVQTEGNAGLRMLSYGETIPDPLLREAVLMNGNEEARHKEVLHHMVNAYGVRLQPEPVYVKPADLEWGYMITGFSECIDSFFAFGLFALAKRSGFFPQPLVDTFEPVIQEECRHILFYANWFAWKQHQLPFLKRMGFYLKCLGIFVTIVKERLKTAGDVSDTENFTVTGHKSMGIDVDVADLLRLCVAENDRRFAGYDIRLVRPTFIPRLARVALFFMGLGKKKN